MILLHKTSTKQGISVSIQQYMPRDQKVFAQETRTNNLQIQHGDAFAPGTLPLSTLESFQRCYVDKRYKSGCSVFSISQKYGVIYHLIPKSASSSLRTIMKHHFNASEHSFRRFQQISMQAANFSAIHFTFFRDPLTRFISGFSEITSRIMRNSTPPYIPSKYTGYLKTLDSHLQNDTLVADERGKESKKDFLYRYYSLTKSEEGVKAYVEVLEQFVSDYDGRTPFNEHIIMQVAGKLYLIQESLGFPLHFAFLTENGIVNQIQDVIYPTVTGKQLALPNLTERNDRPNSAGNTTSFIDYLSTATLQKICQMSAIDYCCLNYPLPPACEDVIHCRWTNQTIPGSFPEREGLLSIEAVSPNV